VLGSEPADISAGVLGSGFDLIARIVTQSADETTAVQQDLATSVTSREFGQMVTEDPTFLAEGNLTVKVQGKPVLTGFKIKEKSNYNLEITLGSVLPFLCCCLSGILWRKKRRKDNDEKNENEAVKYGNTQDALGALGVDVAADGITNPTKN
jgi:hypothetical protein